MGPVFRYFTIRLEGGEGQRRGQQQVVLLMEVGHALAQGHGLVDCPQVAEHRQLCCLVRDLDQFRIHQGAFLCREITDGVGGTAVEQMAKGGQWITEPRVGP